MNVTPIHRLFREDIKQDVVTLGEVKRLLDRYMKEFKESQQTPAQQTQIHSTPVQPAAYYLDNVVRPRAAMSDTKALTGIEKILYFLAGVVTTLVLFIAVRQIDQRKSRRN